uniref:Uncharacterized protein n=1 Tax=Oryza sativa subsp. japonica TaxID=39947 RepID=Q8H5V0_ORYSJ|nr:hypothetical protein [Oryza sativa Japonica Group]
MEFGWTLRRPMRLPDSPRHERGLPAALRGVGVKPEVWCAWLEGVMRRVLSRPLSGFVRAVEDACGVVFPLQSKSRLSSMEKPGSIEAEGRAGGFEGLTACQHPRSRKKQLICRIEGSRSAASSRTLPQLSLEDDAAARSGG